VPLEGGNLTSVRRIGDTVRRSTGPWSVAVHGLLRHLEVAGFTGAPRFLGLDPAGQEILDWIPGRTVGPPPWPAWVWGEEVLTGVGRFLRGYHGAVRDFAVPPHVRWRTAAGPPGHGEIICHNDIGPSNLVFDGTRIVGLIDWDLAAPARPAWDLAHAAWMTVPLMSPTVASRHGIEIQVHDQAERLRALCSAYGTRSGVDLVDVVVRRIDAGIGIVTTAAQRGDAPLARLAEFVPAMRDTVAHIRRHAPVLRRALPG
jgi:hypothetical protein